MVIPNGIYYPTKPISSTRITRRRTAIARWQAVHRPFRAHVRAVRGDRTATVCHLPSWSSPVRTTEQCRFLHSVNDGGRVSLGDDERQLPPMTGAHQFDQWAYSLAAVQARLGHPSPFDYEAALVVA